MIPKSAKLLHLSTALGTDAVLPVNSEQYLSVTNSLLK